jgi:flagellar basal body-associated protein FliL
MSNADPKDNVAPVESSRFGKRFGRIAAIVLLVLAALVAAATFLGNGSQSASEPAKSTNPF